MQMTEDLIRNVVQAGPLPDGQRGHPDQWQGGRPAGRETSASSRPWMTPSGRPRPPSSSSAAAAGRPQEGRRVHPQDLRRPGRGARPARARGDQDRPARPQDRQARRDDPADPGRRVPAHRQRHGRRRHDAHRLHPLRRHRRDHAGHPQPADPGRQRDQHAGRGQHGRLQRPSLGGATSPPRACAASTRRSARRSASRTC